MNSKVGVPKHSVIVTNYNYGRFLRECLQSVFDQEVRADEIVIIDDGSSDESLRVIEEMRRSRPDLIVVQQNRKGQAEAFNSGFLHVKGEFVSFLDSDDYWYIDKLSGVEEAFASKETVLVQHPLDLIDVDSKPFPNTEPHPGGLPPVVVLDDYFRLAGTDFFSATSGLTFRRDALSKLFPIDSQWKICADVCVTRPILIFGRTVTLPDPLGAYRVHGGNAWMGSEKQREFWSNHLSRVRYTNEMLARFNVKQRIHPYRRFRTLFYVAVVRPIEIILMAIFRKSPKLLHLKRKIFGTGRGAVGVALRQQSK